MSVEGMKVALCVGEFILDEVEKEAKKEADKELRFKRSLKRFTGKRGNHK